MPDLTRDVLIEATTKALIERGAGPDNSIHSWRCNWPNTYGDCDCVDETSQTVVDAVLRRVADDLDGAADDADCDCQRDSDATTCDCIRHLTVGGIRDAADHVRSLLPSTEGDQS